MTEGRDCLPVPRTTSAAISGQGFDLGRPAHIGHVVADLDAAMEQYTRELGTRWSPVAEYGRGRRASRFACSVGGSVLVELIQEVVGTIWTAEDTPFHHLAYWTDDLPATATDFVRRGLRIEASGPTFSYLRSTAGMRLELMDASIRPAWERWLAGGRLF